MSEHIVPQYRQMFLSDEVTFTIKAVDACIFMAWCMQHSVDTEMVDHVFAEISHQFEKQLFDTASVKAARAHYAEQHQQNDPVTALLGRLGVPVQQIIDPAAFSEPGIRYIIECGVCGSKDEYDTLPTSELTCGHSEGRLIGRELRDEQ